MNKYCISILLLLAFILTACVPAKSINVGKAPEITPVKPLSNTSHHPNHSVAQRLLSMRDYLRNDIVKGKTVAVSYIFDEENGNVTALGDWYRQQLERELVATGCQVKMRKGLNLLMQESEAFGAGFDVAAMQQLQADILYIGNYRLVADGHGGKCALLSIKGSKVNGATVVESFQCKEPLPSGWARLAGSVKGNVYQQQVRDSHDFSLGGKPHITAHLDRNPACYCAGDAAQITVVTEPGCYLYLLSLAADNSVTLLYPNSLLSQHPLVSGTFIFPPQALQKRLKLQFYPLSPAETNSEVIKVIASRQPLDFSYLPVPENQIYTGAQGGDIKEIAQTLQLAQGWSEVLLPYYVGKDCAE